jgi:hypothetical protein
MIFYIIIGIACYVSIEMFMIASKLSLIQTMQLILNEDKHRELKETYSIRTLHFLFSGLCILFWPVVLTLLVVK